MKKKLFVFVCLFSLLFSMKVFAYTDGIKNVDLNLNNYISITNGSVSDGKLFCSSGKINYEIYIPFYTYSVEIFGESNGNFDFILNNIEYEINLDGSGRGELFFDDVLKPGSYDVIISATNEISLDKIRFHKEDASVPTYYPASFPKLSEYETALQTAVVVCRESPIILVNGSMRYIDVNDTALNVLLFNDRMYLPIKALARALGYYYEDIPEKSYSLMQYKNFSYIIRNGSIYKKDGDSSEELVSAYAVYKNGETWLPLRYFAEETGKKVVYKNGIAIIDYSRYINSIMRNEIFSMLETELEPYKNEKKITSNTYHVAKSENASDDNEGSAEYPFLTLEKACEVASSGDTVIIHKGIYRETLKPQYSGTIVNPITFKAAEGEEVVISANETVKDFFIDSGKILCAKAWNLGLGRNMVFYNGDAIPEARHPNDNTSQRYQPKDISKFFMTLGNIQNSSYDSMKFISYTDLYQEPDFWKGGIFVGFSNGGWYPTTGKITSSKAGSISIGEHTDVWFEEENNLVDCGYITGTKNAVDVAGEWFVDSEGYIYIIPPEGENFATLEIEMKKRQLTIDLTNRKNIIIQGIETVGGGINMNNSEMCILNNNKMNYISHFTYADSQLRGNFDKSYDCISSGENGIYIDGKNNAVVNSKINHSAGYAIYILGKYTYIENNEIANCGYIGRGGIYMSQNPEEGFDSVSGGHFIYSNEIYNTNREAISVCAYEPWFSSYSQAPSILPIEIAYNDIYNASLFARDSGSIYMHGTILGSDRLYTKIHHNYIHDTGNYDSFYADIYLDNHCQFGEIYNNIVYSKDEKCVRNNPVYIQNHPVYMENGSFAYGKAWRNFDFGYYDRSIYDFDFYAGRHTTDFLNNYNKYID